MVWPGDQVPDTKITKPMSKHAVPVCRWFKQFVRDKVLRNGFPRKNTGFVTCLE